MTLSDQAERDRLVNDLGRNLFVEAGAGTGKTRAVVNRVVASVASGRLTMERLVAITFTVAAAGELRVRIREGLEAAARQELRDAGERDRCALAAQQVERGRIETIHAFCSELLRMHPLEAGLPPDFEVLDPVAADIGLRERFRAWFDALRPDDPTAGAMRQGLLLGLTPVHLQSALAAIDENVDLLDNRMAWTTTLPAGTVEKANDIGAALRDASSRLVDCHAPDALYSHVQRLQPVALRLLGAESVDDALGALATAFATILVNKGNKTNWHGDSCRVIKTTLRDARADAEELLAAARTAITGSVASDLCELVRDYARDRPAQGHVSYQDLLLRARDLVRDAPVARDSLRRTWDLIIVDEFQDTDPLQAELAFLLAAEPGATVDDWLHLPLRPGALCVVGDPKQSIYRFRRADIAMYAGASRALVAEHPEAQVRLQVNFRSGTRIIDAVNAAFGGGDGLMHPGDRPSAQATYVDLVAHDPGIAGSVRVFGGALEASAADMWREEARATAAVVTRLLAERWKVGVGTEDERGARESDVCILMPSRTNLRNVERELEGARIRYRLESAALMVATQEVRDLLNCLRSIDDPSDEVALVAALRSPAYGCSDVELLQWHEGGGRWSYRMPGKGAVQRVADALADLAELHGLRQTLSPPAIVEALIGRRLLRAVAADGWRPRETMRRLRWVADQAAAIGRTGRATLHEAVEHLERLEDDPRFDSVTTGDDVEDCVRVMTIHAAKGLEFAVVIVTGLGRKPPPDRSLVICDRQTGDYEVKLSREFTTGGWPDMANREKEMQAAEGVRLLYVALTRARDHLVVSGFRGAKGGESTDAYKLVGRLSTAPDVEVVESGTTLALPSVPPVVAPVEMDPHVQRVSEDEWVARRHELMAALGALHVTSATGVAHEPGAPATETATDVATQRRGRGGTSLGRAVHAVLQVIDLRTLDGVEGHARAQAAAEGIPERAAGVERLVRAACATEAVQRAAASRHWRELPIGAEVGTTIVEGFIDLLYEDPDGRLVVLDYKTDAITKGQLEARADRYRLQGSIYALLVQQALGRDVARVEFAFAALGQTRAIADLPQAVVDARDLITRRTVP